ncbi:unnamed protein product [Spirodela intermedia]|uniref:BRISC and BRCA1-A complex member 2 n=1 Tax=Spirodela intermedia TaxID=51605 RepID=A0A7I8IZH2_SPIIN|nr:unnamed protein product [Spirodela intermedia]CAA6663209.1 unnamed protein product [Spirodela intermedia]
MSGAFESLPPLIAAQLNYLLAHSSLPVKVEQIWSGCKNAQYSDRFTLLVPFCLDHIKEIIYNAYYPSAAPDVVFPSEDEDFHPLPFLEDDEGGEARADKSSLCNWDGKDPSRLLALIHEMRYLYIHHQRRRVGELDDPRLKFEINTVLSREGIEVCRISGTERLCNSSADRRREICCALLDMDLNKLVPGCPWRKQQKIHLQKTLVCTKSPANKIGFFPDLKMLFTVDDVKLPPWLNGMCMAEYLPNLEEKLQEQILEAVKAVGARRQFIEALATIFGRPLEADPVFCRTATVLCVSGAFIFLVHFCIPTQFPKHQPILTLESSLHVDLQGRPIKSLPMMEYPWSPRWETGHMVERIFEFLVEECLSFKSYCIEASSRQQ